jgi:hypothetical protein
MGVAAPLTSLKKNMFNFPRRGCEIVAKTCPEVRSCENGTA